MANPPQTTASKADDATSPALWVGWTTVSSRETAGSLADGVVAARLAACAQIDGPIVSVYHWEGRLCRDTEFRVTLKFPAGNAGAVEAWLRARHPYAVPQWVAVEAVHVSVAYGKWVRDATASHGSHEG